MLLRLLTRRNVLHDHFRRCTTSVAVDVLPPPPAAKERAKRKPEKIRELEENFSAKTLDRFPAYLLKRGSQNTERFYLASQEAARDVAKLVTADLAEDTLLAEVNPGSGLLTKELLKSKKVNRLLLIEYDDWFQEGLRQFEGSRVELKSGDFNGQWKQIYLDSLDRGGRLEKLLEGLPRKRWMDEGINFRLFSIVSTLRFFKTLLYSVVNKKGLYGLGRCELVLVVPPLVYVHLTCTKDAGYKLYRSGSVLFQLFFEHQFLGKIKRRDFLPWPANAGNRKYRTQHWQLGLVGADEWYVMRIVPRADLHEHCLPDNLRLLAFFVTQNMISREPSDTGVGVTNDFPPKMNIFTEFGELTPSQVLTLFNEFINWPEFRQSPFLQTMEQHQAKSSNPFPGGREVDGPDDDEELEEGKTGS
ncbi:mitochondrial dimethyladenosine transferase 2 [Culex quinquefasciatus]|uniref:rRNA adenine N(6)-methyltransferase n=1 Tax=Culex quinquefasciatus TaxID=7176 RepID=B0W9B8_CULQU|nr:mitochondrial dimethyladenosine transferase 2 [Culex quinquefasciatus]|eukprot:XP_001845302.1 mitochondrial dimethyladenosine transferase 2 [Culex quinquefasciatus]